MYRLQRRKAVLRAIRAWFNSLVPRVALLRMLRERSIAAPFTILVTEPMRQSFEADARNVRRGADAESTSCCCGSRTRYLETDGQRAELTHPASVRVAHRGSPHRARLRSLWLSYRSIRLGTHMLLLFYCFLLVLFARPAVCKQLRVANTSGDQLPMA